MNEVGVRKRVDFAEVSIKSIPNSNVGNQYRSVDYDFVRKVPIESVIDNFILFNVRFLSVYATISYRCKRD